MTRIRIQFTRFSAFYSPLISTFTVGFLQAEGLEPEHSIAAPGATAIAALQDGTAEVVQSAPSQGISALERGETPPAMHFAQVNEMDGFFLTGRTAEPDFSWDKLAGRRVLVDHGAQPLAMFRYACHKAGIEYGAIEAVDAGGGAEMDAAFRAGAGEYIHQQGPAPQQLEHDRVGHVVARVGEPIGPCAFSSLAATREWLGTEEASAFMRAYRKTRAYLGETPAAEIARAEQALFPRIDRSVLTETIAAYQALGCWSPHVEITRAAFEATLDVFEHAGRITKRHAYEDAIAPPPEG